MSKTIIQGGAMFRVDPGKKPTKAALKRLLKESPKSVRLYGTSNMGPQFNGTADELPDGTDFIVVGPDPYSKRDWYANVHKGRNGQLVCA
jgi:hypothetical protein